MEEPSGQPFSKPTGEHEAVPGPEQEEINAEFEALVGDVLADFKPQARTYQHLSMDEIIDLKNTTAEALMARKEFRKTRTEEGRRLKALLMELHEEIRARLNE